MPIQPMDKPAQILVVDDNPNNLRLLSQILGERGHRLRAVTSGARALASAEIYPPDLILLDIRMPEMDGYEVCQKLKSSDKTQEVPVIFISALDEIQDKVKAFATGGVDYITKPFQVEEVVARVETHLAMRRLQKNLQEANRRMEREMALAARVQSSFMPKAIPRLPGWEIAVALAPAKTTSGDFYDVLRLPGERLGIVMADVMDKGVGAALFMAMSGTLLRTYTLEHPGEPERICHEVNQRILEYTEAKQFVTVFLGILDVQSGLLVYSNAGHNPPVLISGASASPPRLLGRTGPALGILEEARWQQASMQLAPGDVLVLYTDGITEAESDGGGTFELERLVETACGSVRQPAEAIRDAILERVHRFTGGAALADDVALMVISQR